MKSIGIDVGGHGVKAGIVEQGQRVVSHYQKIDYEIVRQNRAIHKRDVPRAPRIAAVIDAVTTLIAIEPSVEAIGLASTGVIDSSTGIVIDEQAPDYIGTHWIDELQQRWGMKYRYYVENDAKAAAWGEYSTWPQRLDSNGKLPSSLVHVIIGSGIGSGIVLNERILAGFHFGAGEFGSLPYCGGNLHKNGQTKIETVSAAPGLLEASGYNTLIELNQGYMDGNIQAKEALEQGAAALGSGLAAIINILGPEVIVIGGGVIDFVPVYISLMIEQAAQISQREAFNGVLFAPSLLKNDAGIIGIAHLAMKG